MRKMSYAFIFIIVIILTVNLVGNRASQDTNLAKEIENLIQKGTTQIDLNEVTNFKWDQVGLFGPYTTDESIEDSMNIKFKGDNGGIDMLDDRFLLVFANGKKAIKTVVLSRKHGSYSISNHTILNVN